MKGNGESRWRSESTGGKDRKVGAETDETGERTERREQMWRDRGERTEEVGAGGEVDVKEERTVRWQQKWKRQEKG